MHTLESLSRMVRQAVEELRLPDEPKRLYDPIRYTLDAGGKRLRPLLSLASAALFADEVEKAVPAALSVEIFHNFTLLHDDIMDNSSLRRGRETVHVKWDENTAILSGDAMLIYAYELAAKSGAETLPLLIPILNRVFMGVCEGQQYDIDFEGREDVSTPEYLHMISLKTATLLGGGMRVGAVVGGADESTAARLYDAGMHLGMAFQLQDDLLDTYGNTTILGKNTGDDIASNKKTFLLIKALELAQDKEKQELAALMESTEPDRQTKVAKVKDIFTRTGAKELAESLVNDYFHAFSRIVDEIGVADSRKQPLRELAQTLIGRER